MPTTLLSPNTCADGQPGVDHGGRVEAGARRGDETVAGRGEVAVGEHDRPGQAGDAARVEHDGGFVVADLARRDRVALEDGEVIGGRTRRAERRDVGRQRALDRCGVERGLRCDLVVAALQFGQGRPRVSMTGSIPAACTPK